jgi:hypothetical protein
LAFIGKSDYGHPPFQFLGLPTLGVELGRFIIFLKNYVVDEVSYYS